MTTCLCRSRGGALLQHQEPSPDLAGSRFPLGFSFCLGPIQETTLMRRVSFMDWHGLGVLLWALAVDGNRVCRRGPGAAQRVL